VNHEAGATAPAERLISDEASDDAALARAGTLSGQWSALDETAHSRRLAADAALVAALADRGFEGEEYKAVFDMLMTDSWSTTRELLRVGSIFRKSSAIGRPIPERQRVRNWTSADRDGLTTDTVLKGSDLFRTYGLLGGRWSPACGSTLADYFQGACILAFRPVYLGWWRQRRRDRQVLSIDATDTEDGRPMELPDRRAADPCDRAVEVLEARRILRAIKEGPFREVAALWAMGETQQDAAAERGLSRKALERRISRLRTRMTQDQAAEGEIS
jgi:hypothetical protein